MGKNNIPQNLKQYLSERKETLFDAWSGKCIGWGYKIVERMSEEDFNHLGKYGSLECSHGGWSSQWYLIDKWLTCNEAAKQYGPLKKVITGPRGGFKRAVYGETTFCSDRLDPRKDNSFSGEIICEVEK